MNSQHPDVVWFKEKQEQGDVPLDKKVLDSVWLKQMFRDAGIDDVGCVEVSRPELAGEHAAIQTYLSSTQTLVSLVGRVQRPNAVSSARSLYNLEQRRCSEQVDQAARSVVAMLAHKQIRAVYLPLAFPMEFESGLRVSHKTVAVAAGMGAMGLSRLLLHPDFGSCILITTVLLDCAVTAYDRPLTVNPCIDCKLCVAACPTGTIRTDGVFKGELCGAHNYRFRTRGFLHWVATLVGVKSVAEYRDVYSDVETLKLWQGLTYEAGNLCGHCVAVCPAGRETIGHYIRDPKRYVRDVVAPLRQRQEQVYAFPGSDSDGYAERHFPRKTTRLIPQ